MTNKQALQNFVLKHAKDKGLIEELRVFEHLQPFFDIAEAGEYNLATEAELDQETVAQAISQATGKEVKILTLVSLSELEFGLNPQKKLRDYANLCASIEIDLIDSLRNSLGVDLIDSLDVNVEDSLGDRLGNILGNSLGVNIWDSFKDRLGDSLGAHVEDRFVDYLRDCRGESLGYILWDCLFYYVGYAVVGERDKVLQLQSFVDLLPKAIPLGEKEDEPTTWLVLVA